jgi:hypothetical protein
MSGRLYSVALPVWLIEHVIRIVVGRHPYADHVNDHELLMHPPISLQSCT